MHTNTAWVIGKPKDKYYHAPWDMGNSGAEMQSKLMVLGGQFSTLHRAVHHRVKFDSVGCPIGMDPVASADHSLFRPNEEIAVQKGKKWKKKYFILLRYVSKKKRITVFSFLLFYKLTILIQNCII